MQLQQPFAISTGINGFQYYVPITIDHTQIPSTQSDFPVAISTSAVVLKTISNGGHVQNTNGYDIRPFSDTGLNTALTYELVTYDPVNGYLEMHVKISSLSSSIDTIIYLAYGNSSITTNGSSTATWSNNFLGVYHLADGTTLNVNSSTGSHNGTNNGATAAVGKIDGAANFVAASNQDIELDTINAAALTYSGWVNIPSFVNAYARVLCVDNLSTAHTLAVKSNGKLTVEFSATTTLFYDGTGSHTLSTNTWYLLTGTYNSTSGLIGYVNAVSDGTVAANGAAKTNWTQHTAIGTDIAGGSNGFNGVIDEVRISSVARSADWITVEYNNQGFFGSGFYTFGTEIPL